MSERARLEAVVQKAVAKRDVARQKKKWAVADELRDVSPCLPLSVSRDAARGGFTSERRRRSRRWG